jgi:hypothetical protein
MVKDKFTTVKLNKISSVQFFLISKIIALP